MKLAGLGRKRVDPFTTCLSYLNGSCRGSLAGDPLDPFMGFFFFKEKGLNPPLKEEEEEGGGGRGGGGGVVWNMLHAERGGKKKA